MNPRKISSGALFGAGAIGVVVGTLICSILRVAYYFAADIQPEMSPMMFIFFIPVVTLAILIPTQISEWLLSRFWWRPNSFGRAILIGCSYSFVLLALISPWLLILLAVTNPISLRYFYAHRDLRVGRG